MISLIKPKGILKNKNEYPYSVYLKSTEKERENKGVLCVLEDMCVRERETYTYWVRLYCRHLLMHLCLRGYYHIDRYLLETSASPRLNNTIVKVWFAKLPKGKFQCLNLITILPKPVQAICKQLSGSLYRGLFSTVPSLYNICLRSHCFVWLGLIPGVLMKTNLYICRMWQSILERI